MKMIHLHILPKGPKPISLDTCVRARAFSS